MRHLGLVAAAALTAVVGAPLAASPQVELDRIVSRVEGRIVTQSDIRQARALKLVEDATTDESTQRALENRLLVLHELERAAPLAAPIADDVEARRNEWMASVGGDQRAPDVLRQAGMSQADLDRWLQNDVRIRHYLQRQFGMLGDAERTRAMAEWFGRLRQRADLP